jgi:hypothetical protein
MSHYYYYYYHYYYWWIFPLASVFRPALRPTQPPVQRVQEVVSPGESAAGA